MTAASTKVIEAVRSLEAHDRYLAAFVFGSVARGDDTAWSRMIDHVLAPLGGRQPLDKTNCRCAVCRADLATLQDAR